MDRRCPYCKAETSVVLIDVISHRHFTATFCCNAVLHEWEEASGDQDNIKAFLEYYSPELIEEIYGANVDKVLTDGIETKGHKNTHIEGFEGFMLSTKLRVDPISFKEMCIFVDKHHRHTKAPRGWKFGLGCYNGNELIGVASVGRPVSRHVDDGETLEVNRVCVNPDIDSNLVHNACSMLYAASAKRAKKDGYKKIVTYTLVTELGTTLKAVGWEIEYTQKKGGSWNSKTRRRGRLMTDGIPKHRWAKDL